MALLSNSTFWVAVAFAWFVVILLRFGVHRSMSRSLDERSARIAHELSEAQRLRQEAETLLKEYQAKRRAVEQEAAAIVKAAEDEAERLSLEAQVRLEEYVRRRTLSAEAKIAQAERQAADEVRAAAADAAVKASESVLRSQMVGAKGEEFLIKNLGNVRAQLN